MTEDEQLKLERIANKGMQADAVINNPVFKESMLHIRAGLMRELEQSTWRQSKLRDEIWRQLKNMDKFEAHIIKVMKNGEFAQKELTLAQRLKESTHKLFRRA